MGERKHYTVEETRNRFLCSCDDCSRKAAHAWIGQIDKVLSGQQTLQEAQTIANREGY